MTKRRTAANWGCTALAEIITYVAKHASKQSLVDDSLRSRIVSGEFPPGSRIPPFTQLEKELDASRVTVRLAVKRLCEQGFVVTKRPVGTFVSDNPPHLANIGLVIQPPAANGWQSLFRKALVEQAAELSSPSRRMWVHEVREGPFHPEDHRWLVDEIRLQRVAGLIFAHQPYLHWLAPLMEEVDLPRVVFTGQPVPSANVVSPDRAMLRDKALGYLAAQGRRRPAFLFCADHPLDLNAEAESLAPHLERHGMETRRHWFQSVAPYRHEWVANCVELLLRCAEPPDSLAIMDDNLVEGATAGIAASGCVVEKEFTVVAHCNFPLAPKASVPVKFIGYDVRQIMRTFIDIISRRRRGEDVPPITVVPAYMDDQIAASQSVERR